MNKNEIERFGDLTLMAMNDSEMPTKVMICKGDNYSENIVLHVKELLIGDLMIDINYDGSRYTVEKLNNDVDNLDYQDYHGIYYNTSNSTLFLESDMCDLEVKVADFRHLLDYLVDINGSIVEWISSMER